MIIFSFEDKEILGALTLKPVRLSPKDLKSGYPILKKAVKPNPFPLNWKNSAAKTSS